MNDKPGISPALRRVVLIALILMACLCAGAGYLVARSVAPLATTYAGLIGALALAVGLLAALGGLRILFAYGRRAAALARQAEIVMMQNQQPIHLDDVTVLARPLLARSLDRYYDQQLALAERSQFPNLTSIHQVVQPIQAAPVAPALPDAGLQLIPDTDWRRWMDRAPHLLIAGRTEAGKTTLATALLTERALAGDQILVLDPHYQPGKWASMSAIGGGNDWNAILATMPHLIAEMESRYKEFEQGKPTEAFDRLTVLIDEVPAIVEACMGVSASGRPRMDDLRWIKFAKRLGSEARKVRISVILMTQSTLVADIYINSQQRENYLRVALGDRSRDLIAEERDSRRKAALTDLLRGQQYPAAIEWWGNFHLLDTSAVPDLAARQVAHARVWSPPALLGSAAQQNTPTPPRSVVPPTVELPPPTVKDQIVMLLEARDGQWLTHSEMAAALGVDLGVIQTEAKALYDAGVITRRSTRRNNERIEYSTNQPTRGHYPAIAA